MGSWFSVFLCCFVSVFVGQAEYSDLKTIWERTNDAINMIIRRDESTESGELLQPCIEGTCTSLRFFYSHLFSYYSTIYCFFILSFVRWWYCCL